MSEVAVKTTLSTKPANTRSPIERGSRYVLVDEVYGCTGMYRITSNLKSVDGRCFEHFSESKWTEFKKLGTIKATPRILKGDLELLVIAAEYFKLEEYSEVLEPETSVLTLPKSTLVLEYIWKAKKWQYQGHKFLSFYSAAANNAE